MLPVFAPPCLVSAIFPRQLASTSGLPPYHVVFQATATPPQKRPEAHDATTDRHSIETI